MSLLNIFVHRCTYETICIYNSVYHSFILSLGNNCQYDCVVIHLANPDPNYDKALGFKGDVISTSSASDFLNNYCWFKYFRHCRDFTGSWYESIKEARGYIVSNFINLSDDSNYYTGTDICFVVWLFTLE